jgi:hypothetical protein
LTNASIPWKDSHTNAILAQLLYGITYREGANPTKSQPKGSKKRQADALPSQNNEAAMIDENHEFTSLRDVAKYAHITPQAVYSAIQKGQLKATKKRVLNKRGCHLEQWTVLVKDLEEYRMSKYDRDKRIVDGEKLFDIEHDRWSVLHAAKTLSLMLGIPFTTQKMYYLLRVGKITAYKKGGAWIIKKEELLRIYQEEMHKLPENKENVAQ